MIFGVCLSGFCRVLLRVHVLGIRQMSEVAGLLVAAGVVMFDGLSMMARRLLMVLRCCFVVFRFRSGNGKIGRLCAVAIGNYP